MILARRLSFGTAVLTGSILISGLVSPGVRAQGPAPAAAASPDVQAAAQALELFNAGKYDEAATIYESITTQHSRSPLVPEATFRLGYIYYLKGDYDKSIEYFGKLPRLNNVPTEILELTLSLTPQVTAAKASKMPPGSPERKKAFEEVVKQYDTFLQKFPQSEEAEAANYGRAVALYQVGRYEDAAAALRTNLQRFAASPAILDSQYLLALTIGTIANVSSQKAGKADPAATALYDEADRLLSDIITKWTDVALANDARFQLGELNLARAAFADPKNRNAILNRALDNYRLVASKDLVIQAQRARVEQMKRLRADALEKRDLAGVRRFQRLQERETEKLAQLESREDQTLTAKLKAGQVFFQMGRADETRVTMTFLSKFAEDPENKKEVAYFTALSYATQNVEARGRNEQLAAKTEESYKAFKAAYPGDKIAENLAIVVGSGFVDSAPEKANEYFQESLAEYPQGRFRMEALTEQARALKQLRRYDEALNMYKRTLEENPSKEIAAAAQFGIADIQRETGNRDEAITTYKTVRDQYAGTPQAEHAAFFIGQLMLDKGSAKEAVTELQNFAKNFPNSELLPDALFTRARAELASGKKDAAIATYKEIPVKFPESKVAPYSYFQRAQILLEEQKFDDVVATIQEFIKKYPKSEALFQAYEFLAQIQNSRSNPAEAIRIYEDFAKANPQNANAPTAILKAAGLWKVSAESKGRYITLNEEQKAEWTKALEQSIATAERIVSEYPKSPEVALALKNLVDCQKLRQQAKLVTAADVETYFQTLAQKYEDQPATRSKIIFALASYTFEQDKQKAIEQMASAYKPDEKYAPADLDLYGQALIQQGKLDEAMSVYEKLAADYPTPKNVEPSKASREIQDAQAISLFGQGKALQEQKKLVEAQQKFDQLKRLYPWSPKLHEANFGIALSNYEQKKYDEGLQLLSGVVRESKLPAELRAKAMLLFARIHEDKGNASTAIDNYIKIASFYSGVPDVAAEGLWRGAQLLEKQGNGQLPMPTPVPKSSTGTKTTGNKSGK